MNQTRNAATAWSSGYCTDIPYTMGAYKQLSPITLGATAGLKGRAAPDFSGDFTYLELGCGNAISAVTNAAMYPRGQFYAVDFNPEHVSFARELASETGLTNINVFEYSFAEAAEAPEGTFPQFDVIAFHGVWSWISDENRSHILSIIRRHLKTGGLVYVSYNCQPGWSALMPVRHLVHQHAARQGSGRSDLQTVAGLKYVRKLLDDGAVYDRLFPGAKATIDRSLESTQSAYLAHEWFNRDMYAPFSSDVIADLLGVKCNYIGSADASSNVDAISVPEKIRPELAGADEALRETLIDFAAGRKFRQDIYGRGTVPLSGTQQARFADSFAFVQYGELPAADNVTIGGPIGEVKGAPEVFGPILQALAEGEVTLSSLRTRPDADPKSKTVWLNDILLLAWQSGILTPAAPQADLSTESSAAFNRTVCARHAAGDKRVTTLAMPEFGIPAMVRAIDINLTDLLLRNPKIGFHGAVDQLLADTAAAGSSFLRNGQPVADAAEARTVAEDLIRGFFTGTAPFLVRGGALPKDVLLDAPAKAPEAVVAEAEAAA